MSECLNKSEIVIFDKTSRFSNKRKFLMNGFINYLTSSKDENWFITNSFLDIYLYFECLKFSAHNNTLIFTTD